MKKSPVTFRIQDNLVVTLDELSNKLSVTKTDIVERSIQDYAKKYLQSRSAKHPLSKFAGILNADEANDLQNVIKNSRVSKSSLIN